MVATVTRLTEAASTVHYFEVDGYYAKNDLEHRKASRWHGRGVEALGLHGPVKPKRFEEVLSGRIPGTKTRLGRLRKGRHEHRPGLDITFSAPKSVSLEALVHAAPKAAARIIRAHDEAVTATLDFIERELLETRGWDPATRKRPRIKADGLVAATFRHYASRNLDPQLHTHSVVANMTRNPDGEWRSADFIRIERAKLLIGAHYRAELRRRIEALGYATEQTMVGSVPGFEIAGYDKATLEAFSTRRAQAVAWARERNLDEQSAAVMQQAVLYTRKRKDEPSREELANIWKARMAECAPRNRHISRNRPASHTRLDRERWHLARRGVANRQSPSALHAVRRAVEHIEERRTVFTADMLRALVLAPGRWTLKEVDAAIGRLRREGHLIEATAARSDCAFVTDRAVKAERAVLRWMKQESDAPERFAIDADHIERHLAAGALNDGQKAAVNTLLLSSRHVCGVQGHAGTGKTTMLKQVVELAGADRIVALAPSSSAARTLQRETGIGTKTLQWFLTRYRDVGDGCADIQSLARAREALEGTLLVVDEASLISMAQMHGLSRIAEATGIARVALVGDRAQLRSVEAGQPFRVLQKAGMETAVMDEVLRQRNESLKAAVLHMIEGKPDLAIEELGPGVLEMDADELGPRAAALWLDLDRESRKATKVLAPTHARRREITQGIRDGLKAEGNLHGRTLEIERYVNLHLTRAQKGDLDNWREGDIAVFHADVYGVQAKSGDIFGVIGSQGEKVLLRHPDGKTRRADPSKYLRYRVDLFETEPIELQAGERIRWTRNDKERGLLNGEEARVLSIGKSSLWLQAADGRTLTLAHDDPHLHFIDHAWTSTVHAAQGMTCDQVIAVLDANQGAITGQAAFYVELTRARDNAVLLTDDRDALVEALETATGDELSALEAIGGQFREEGETRVDVLPKPVLSDDALQDVRGRTKGLEELRALEPHLDRCLEERLRLEDAADGAPLSGMDGYAAWKERTTAALDIGGEVAGRIDWTETAETLQGLLAFDNDVLELVEKLRRHVAKEGEPDEDSLLSPDARELVQHVVLVGSEAPPYARLPWDLDDLVRRYETTTGTDALDLLFSEEELLAVAHAERPQSGEAPQMPATDHDAAEAPAETPAGDHISGDDVVEGLAAAIEERRALVAEAEGRLISSLAAYASWRKRAEAAVDAWQRRDGALSDVADRDAARLGRAFDLDDGAVDLVARLEAHEAEARAAARDPQAGLDVSLLAMDCINNMTLRILDGEPLPRVLADFMERRDAWRAERKKQEAQPGPVTGVKKAQPATTAPAPRPAPAASPPSARKSAPERAPTMTRGPAPAPGPSATPPTRQPTTPAPAPRPAPAASPPAARKPAPERAPKMTRGPAPAPAPPATPPTRKPATPAPAPRPAPAASPPPARKPAPERAPTMTRGPAPAPGPTVDPPTRQPATTAPAPRPAPAASPPSARKPAPERTPTMTREPAPAPGPPATPPTRQPATPAPRPVRPAPPPAEVSSPSIATPPPPAPDPVLAAQAIARALQERQRLQYASEGQALASLAAWKTWRRETRSAIADWKAGAAGATGATTWRDAERLEALVAFDTEANALVETWRHHADDAGRTGGDAFGHPDAGRILAAIRRLKDQAPQDAVLPQALARALKEADTHARERERVETLLASVSALDRDRRVLLEREGSRDRPLNRRWNRRWKRWRKEAETLAPVIGELKSPALAHHLDGTEGARALVSRVERMIAKRNKRDTLPGWLLLRLHDNAEEADRRGVHPTQTPAWKDIIPEMTALYRRLEADDPRCRMLWQETYDEDRRNEVKAEVRRLAGKIDHFHRRARSLATEAGKEGLALHQSAAYKYWHDATQSWTWNARRVLGREGAYGEVLADGSATARDMAEAMAAFEEIRKAYGPPDDSVRMERRREEQRQEQSRSRSRGFSM